MHGIDCYFGDSRPKSLKSSQIPTVRTQDLDTQWDSHRKTAQIEHKKRERLLLLSGHRNAASSSPSSSCPCPRPVLVLLRSSPRPPSFPLPLPLSCPSATITCTDVTENMCLLNFEHKHFKQNTSSTLNRFNCGKHLFKAQLGLQFQKRSETK